MNRIVCLFIVFTTTLLSCNDKHQESKVVSEEENNQINVKEQSTDKDKSTILCFGNSLTAGYGLDEQYAWPSLLQNRIDSLGLDYKTINAGLSGETTSGGLKRINWVLKQPVDIFILELGANDMLRGLDVSVSESNLDQILTTVKSKYPDAKCVLAGMLSPPNMGPEYENAFNGMYARLAQKHNATLIPFFLANVAGEKTLNLQDGKHPNKKGQKIVLETVWEYVSPLL